jgi:limonene-1,2-epoxide hydrolase
MVAQPGANLMGFDQERWTAALHYEKQPVEDVLAAFRGLRRMTANMLRGMNDEAWNNKGIHPKRGEMSVLALVEGLAGHCENHSRTIRELRERFSAAKA